MKACLSVSISISISLPLSLFEDFLRAFKAFLRVDASGVAKKIQEGPPVLGRSPRSTGRLLILGKFPTLRRSPILGRFPILG